MAEISVARERGVNARNALRQGNGRSSSVPSGDRGLYDDSFATVYDAQGRIVERGMWDDSVYRDENIRWNAADGNYDLAQGYKLVIRN